MTKAIVKNDDNFKAAITNVNFKKEVVHALGKNGDVEKYIRGVLTTIALNKDLQICSIESVLKSILVSAQLCLQVDAKGHGYLIPFQNHKAGTVECNFMAGYKGYIFKIRSSAKVKNVYTEAVYEGAEFKVIKGSDPKIIHIPDLMSNNYGKEDKIKFFYAVVKFVNGEDEFEIMTREQVDKIKDNARTQYIWNAHYQEMGRKTVIRRLEKKLQLPELENIIVHESETDKKIYKDYTYREKKEYTEDEKLSIDENIRAYYKKLGWAIKKFNDFVIGMIGKEFKKCDYEQREKMMIFLKQEIDDNEKMQKDDQKKEGVK